MEVVLKDGNKLDVESGSSLLEVAGKISNRLRKEAIVGKINDKLVDLTAVVKDGDKVELFTLDSPEGLDTYRHSSAHIMAEAVGAGAAAC